MINMSTNGGGSSSANGGGSGSGIRNSMLRHWRNSSISLSRSGSKSRKDSSKTEEKAAKRLSIPFISGNTPSTPKSPEAPAAIQPPPPNQQADTPADDMASSSNGFSLHVTVHIAPENVDRFLAAFKIVFDVVAAEPECTFFEVYRSPEEPGKISWVENWSKDRQWFIEQQITKAYYKEYLELTEPMFLKPREVAMLELAGPGFSVIKGNPI